MKYIFEESDIKKGLCVETSNRIFMIASQQSSLDFVFVNLTQNYATIHSKPELIKLLNKENYSPVSLQHNIIG